VEEYVYYIGDSFAGLVYLIVGVRLFALSVRNAQTPDRLLSVTFLLWAFNYFLYDIPSLFFYGEALLPPLFSISSALTLYLGTITFAVFTWAVFRNQERRSKLGKSTTMRAGLTRRYKRKHPLSLPCGPKSWSDP